MATPIMDILEIARDRLGDGGLDFLWESLCAVLHDLMEAEGSSALRRAKLTRAFNQGYRSYSRTYNTCSPSAQTAITRSLSEGSELSEGLLKAFP